MCGAASRLFFVYKVLRCSPFFGWSHPIKCTQCIFHILLPFLWLQGGPSGVFFCSTVGVQSFWYFYRVLRDVSILICLCIVLCRTNRRDYFFVSNGMVVESASVIRLSHTQFQSFGMLLHPATVQAVQNLAFFPSFLNLWLLGPGPKCSLSTSFASFFLLLFQSDLLRFCNYTLSDRKTQIVRCAIRHLPADCRNLLKCSRLLASVVQAFESK